MMQTNKQPIHCPLEFLKLLRAATKADKSLSSPDGRRCVIVRCPSQYGQLGSVTIAWEGSPPKWTVIVNGMGYATPSLLVVRDEQVKSGDQIDEAYSIIKRFLDAHPANQDGSPVWIDCADLTEADSE